MRQPFGTEKDQSVGLRLDNYYGSLRTLADFQGIESCSVVKRGHTTTITIVSDVSTVYEKGWEIRPAGRRSRPASKPAPR